jgi:CIC family chloride channel protein
MGAVFAGIVRAPMTSILIVFEMTGGYGLVLPLMIANMTAFALARYWRETPIYEALLAQDGIELPHGTRPLEPPSDEPIETHGLSADSTEDATA